MTCFLSPGKSEFNKDVESRGSVCHVFATRRVSCPTSCKLQVRLQIKFWDWMVNSIMGERKNNKFIGQPYQLSASR
jgi:hypothetical protein